MQLNSLNDILRQSGETEFRIGKITMFVFFIITCVIILVGVRSTTELLLHSYYSGYHIQILGPANT